MTTPNSDTTADMTKDVPSIGRAVEPETELVEHDDGDWAEFDYTEDDVQAPEQSARRGRPKGAKNKVHQKVARSLRPGPRLHFNFMALVEPNCFNEAMASDQQKEWTLAMNDEMVSLAKNKT